MALGRLSSSSGYHSRFIANCNLQFAINREYLGVKRGVGPRCDEITKPLSLGLKGAATVIIGAGTGNAPLIVFGAYDLTMSIYSVF